MNLRLFRLAAFTAVVACGFAVVPAAALACNPMRSNNYPTTYWGGWTRDHVASGNWKTVQADIEEIDPYVFTDSNIDASANGGYTWIMLDSSNGWYDQIGSFKNNNKVRHVFIADIGPSTNGEQEWSFAAQPTGGTTTYKITHTGTQFYHNYVNGTDIFESPVSFTQNGAEAASEIHSRADQFPGTSGDHEGITNATVTDLGGTTQDFDGTVDVFVSPPITPPAWQHVYKAGTGHLETWDGDC